MPPLFGYGAAFAGLAGSLRACALYAFDFIEDHNAVSQYARQILSIQPEGSHALLGYSGGGNLAFEVAQEMERQGHPVADLILLDAPLRRRTITMSDAEIREMMDGNLGYFRQRMEDLPDYRIFVTDPQMKQLMLRKMESFIRYLNSLVNTGTIAADIHLVRSEQEWAEPADWDEWAARTSGALHRYQGLGDHAHLTDARNLAANSEIIARILGVAVGAGVEL